MITLINSGTQPFMVLSKTFCTNEGVLDGEVWQEKGYKHWAYVIGIGHCPPLFCEKIGMAKVDFDALKRESFEVDRNIDNDRKK